MNIGLMLLYENWNQDYLTAFENQKKLVLLAEELNFDDAWITEHHFNRFSLSSSILTLLGHLIGVTKKINIGSASILTPIYNPIIIAEAIATLDILSQNRFYFGVAKGGAFEKQNRFFDLQNSREKMLENLEQILELLKDESVIYPKTSNKIPMFIASKDDTSIEFATKHNIGLMSAHLWSKEIIQESIRKFKNLSGIKPKMMCSRGFYIANSEQEAIDEALPALKRFREEMESQGISNPIFYDENYWIENAIIGDIETCCQKVDELKAIGVTHLALKPISNSIDKNINSLNLFATNILKDIR